MDRFPLQGSSHHFSGRRFQKGERGFTAPAASFRSEAPRLRAWRSRVRSLELAASWASSLREGLRPEASKSCRRSLLGCGTSDFASARGCSSKSNQVICIPCNMGCTPDKPGSSRPFARDASPSKRIPFTSMFRFFPTSWRVYLRLNRPLPWIFFSSNRPASAAPAPASSGCSGAECSGSLPRTGEGPPPFWLSDVQSNLLVVEHGEHPFPPMMTTKGSLPFGCLLASLQKGFLVLTHSLIPKARKRLDFWVQQQAYIGDGASVVPQKWSPVLRSL